MAPRTGPCNFLYGTPRDPSTPAFPIFPINFIIRKILYFLYFGTKAPYFLYFDIKFGTVWAIAHLITKRFGPEVQYQFINSKIFPGPGLIEKISVLYLFFSKIPEIRVLHSYKTPIIRT